MKKEYVSPEWDVLKLQLESIMDNIKHSIPEGFADGGEEGPEE